MSLQEQNPGEEFHLDNRVFSLGALDSLDPVTQRGLRHGPHPHQRVLVTRGAHHADPLLDPRVSKPVRLSLRLVLAVNLHRVLSPAELPI